MCQSATRFRSGLFVLYSMQYSLRKDSIKVLDQELVREGRSNVQSVQGRVAVAKVEWIGETMAFLSGRSLVGNGRPRDDVLSTRRQGRPDAKG
jgi:hypothetical protein